MKKVYIIPINLTSVDVRDIVSRSKSGICEITHRRYEEVISEPYDGSVGEKFITQVIYDPNDPKEDEKEKYKHRIGSKFEYVRIIAESKKEAIKKLNEEECLKNKAAIILHSRNINSFDVCDLMRENLDAKHYNNNILCGENGKYGPCHLMLLEGCHIADNMFDRVMKEKE